MPLVAKWAELYAESEYASGVLFERPQALEAELAVQEGGASSSARSEYVKDEPNSEGDQEFCEAVLANPLKVKEEIPQEQPVHKTSSDHVAEDKRCSLMETVSVKEEPIPECNQQVSGVVPALLADLSNKVQVESPQHTSKQMPVNVTTSDHGGKVYTYSKVKTDCVKKKPESERDKRVSEYRSALLADLSNNVNDELDMEKKHPVNVASTDPTGCTDVSGERAMQQIVDGCYVKLQRLTLSLQCNVCRKMFQKKMHLESHTCNKIDAFENEKETHVNKLLNNEITTSDNLKVYTCNICYEEYPFLRSLKLHERKHSKKDVVCGICKRDFTNKYRLEMHMLTHLDAQKADSLKPIACDLCNKVFIYRSKLRRHRHTCASWFTCDVCKKKFKLESNLIDHKKSHTGEKTFTCEYCKKQFDDCSRCIAHKKTHRKTFYECDVCKRKFYQKSFIIEHLGVHTDDERYVCGICETIFIDKSQFEGHKKLHSNKQVLKCDVCGEVFRKQSSFTSHMISHTGEKPYKCDICQKTFRFRYYLSEHKRIHTADKPYVCDICKKAFASQPNLEKHKKSHMAYKPYICHFCKKSYIQKSDLNVHIRIHTGEKPFVCNICGRAFRHNTNLYAHKITVHKKVEGSPP